MNTSTAAPPLDLDGLGDILQGLADPIRVRLLNAVTVGELCVCDLVELLGAPQPTVSRHLMLLRERGLVERHRRGRFAYYRLASGGGPVRDEVGRCIESFAAVPELGAERRRAAGLARRRAATPC